ncbi:MAG: hypothetical protein L7F77_08020, partial [Candidatus Magnetominusculus sp. LBB02]|nr:hypothetical protein [Candidatus Magnetominusculus sp. LBB02]
LRNGSPMQFSAKPQKTPLMMLKAIIAAGGRHVDTTLLADQLWPDEDGDAAHNLFGTNIHRLRKLLGGKEFINYTDGDLCLNPELCWVDIWAFDDIVNRINNTFHSGDEQSVISLFEQMCSLYKGEFIPGLQNESWAIHTRARLSSSLVESCTQTGTWLENRNKWEEAAHCYKRTIAIHDSDEHLYQRLMQCYHALGRNADVISTYKQCKAALLSKFGVEPSPATVAICESVNNSSQ